MSFFNVISVPKGHHVQCSVCLGYYMGTPRYDYEMTRIGEKCFCEDCLKELIKQLVLLRKGRMEDEQARSRKS